MFAPARCRRRAQQIETRRPAEEAIGSVAATHYSFMGAAEPAPMEVAAREVAGRLKSDKVDAVILSPV